MTLVEEPKTPIIKKTRAKRIAKSVSQENLKATAVDVPHDDEIDKALDAIVDDTIKKTNETTPATTPKKGRKTKYANDEERAAARKAQQKAYRERKKKELIELKKAAEANKNNQ